MATRKNSDPLVIEADGSPITAPAVKARRPVRQRGEKVSPPTAPKAIDPELMHPVEMADGSMGWRSRFLAALLGKEHRATLRAVRSAIDGSVMLLTYEQHEYKDGRGNTQPEIIASTAAWVEILSLMRSPDAARVTMALMRAEAESKVAAVVGQKVAEKLHGDTDWSAARDLVAQAERACTDALAGWRLRNPELARTHDFPNTAKLHSIVVTGRCKPLFDRETASPAELALMGRVLTEDARLLGADHGYQARKARLLEVAAMHRAKLPKSSPLALPAPAAPLQLEAP